MAQPLWRDLLDDAYLVSLFTRAEAPDESDEDGLDDREDARVEWNQLARAYATMPSRYKHAAVACVVRAIARVCTQERIEELTKMQADVNERAVQKRAAPMFIIKRAPGVSDLAWADHVNEMLRIMDGLPAGVRKLTKAEQDEIAERHARL
jgi:hypothetical protein